MVGAFEYLTGNRYIFFGGGVWFPSSVMFGAKRWGGGVGGFPVRFYLPSTRPLPGVQVFRTRYSHTFGHNGPKMAQKGLFDPPEGCGATFGRSHFLIGFGPMLDSFTGETVVDPMGQNG